MSSASSGERHTFQAETRQLLDIVTNALYTDRHIFLRELISNGSDALEKFRHAQVAGDGEGAETLVSPDRPLEIRITTNPEKGVLVIEDSGIGLSRDEMVKNLGTIAHSGTKEHLTKALESGSASKSDLGQNLIGMFGVGFYSAFMVSDRVVVQSRSAAGEPCHEWASAGDGEYTLSEVEGAGGGGEVALGRDIGTRIELHLKENAKEFANAETVEDIIKRYSNFVAFPIYLNGDQVNTVRAIWTMNPSEVSEQEYEDFFKFKTKQQFGDVRYRLHFRADAPLDLKALFFIGEMHEEEFGMGRMRRGVDLYSRKVLIAPESDLLPEWLRFLQGVVDSEDLPLNISRESMQDTALLSRLRNVLTRRFLRFLQAELRSDRDKYEKFFERFGIFLKEGVCSDFQYQADLSRLLLFESSALKPGEMTTLDEYVSRMPPSQDKVYFLIAPHRGLAERSAYMEAFHASESNGHQATEVLFGYNAIDDFVLTNVRSFNGRTIVSAEGSDLGNLPGHSKKDEDASADGKADKAQTKAGELSEAEFREVVSVFERALPGKIKEVRRSKRLRSTPAVVVDHENAPLRRMMKMMAQGAAGGADSESPNMEEEVLPPQSLEVNTAHPIMRRLYELREKNVDLTDTVARQVFDNALIAAGLLDDPRSMLPRLHALLQTTLDASMLAGSTTPIGADPEGVSRRAVSDAELDVRANRAMVEDVLSDETLARNLADSLDIKDEPEDPASVRVDPPKA